MEGIVTGDWHFGSLSKHFRNPVQRQIAELDKIYSYAVSNGIHHVFVAGDISDTPHMDHDTYIQLVLFLKKFDGIVNTYYIAGNHDFSDIKKTSMDLLKVLCENNFFDSFHLYLSPSSEEIDGCSVFFAPFPCLKTCNYDMPKLNIAHVTYTGAIGDNGRKLRSKHEFEQGPNDFTISGHIHQYQALHNKRALYCGNPYQKTFGEKLPKGFIHFKARTEGGTMRIKHKFVNNKPSFRLVNAHIQSRNDFASLSNSDSVRYKLWLDERVEVPKDLRMQFPNITGGIFDVSTKKLLDSSSIEVPEFIAPSNEINLIDGLGRFFKDNGFTREQFYQARSLVEQARNELGL